MSRPSDTSQSGEIADATVQLASPGARPSDPGHSGELVKTTVKLRAGASRAPSRPPVAAASARPSIAATVEGKAPLDVLHRDEVLRTRRLSVIGMPVAIIGVVAAALIPGDPTARALMYVAAVIAFLSFAYQGYRALHPDTFGGLGVAIGWVVPAVAVSLAIPFFGVFSPAPMLLVLGVYFTGLGSSGRLAVTVYAASALVHSVSSGLMIAGKIRDPGIVNVDGLATEYQIILQLCVHLVLLASFLVARTSRRAKVLAVQELERAMRAVAQRDAVLQEAREALDRALQPGRGRFSEQTLGGYQLGALIGRGAMGEVYESTDRDGRPAAVKVLSQASLGNPDHVERFMRELHTASRIDAPNVVRVLDVGDRPVPYLVMERLDGEDLAQILRRQRGLPPAQVVDLVRQVGAGITAAGAAGVIHRDLKPQNVFLHHGTWKVLDFGVSRVVDHTGSLTAGAVVGTPAYMAPEQARGLTVDHRSDLYALAAIAYRALTGHPPFAGNEPAELMFRVVYEHPRRPSELAAVPADVDAVLAIALAKDPAARFDTADQLATALAAAIAGRLDRPTRARGFGLMRASG